MKINKELAEENKKNLNMPESEWPIFHCVYCGVQKEYEELFNFNYNPITKEESWEMVCNDCNDKLPCF